MTSEDRYTYPTTGDDPRDIDREVSDADAIQRREKGRQVTHAQTRERGQRTSADAPGFDPSDRERADHADTRPDEDAEDQH
jgi:hypothetical protein